MEQKLFSKLVKYIRLEFSPNNPAGKLSSVTYVDGLKVSPKKQAVSFKRIFYYTHGYTAEEMAKTLQKDTEKIINQYNTLSEFEGIAPVIKVAEQHWNNWPRDSYWLVEIGFTVS